VCGKRENVLISLCITLFSEIGAALETKFNEDKIDKVSNFLNQRREMIKNRIDDQFQKAVVCIQSEVKVENEKKLTNFKNIIKEKLNVSINRHIFYNIKMSWF